VTVNPLTSLFSNNFDGQSVGSLQLSSKANMFSSATNRSRLAVENSVASSAPNGLSVSLAGSPSYATKQYSTSYSNHVVEFSLELGSNFRAPSGGYMDLATTATGSSAGKAYIRRNSSGLLDVGYTDNSGTLRAIASSYALSSGSWHTLRLTESTGSGNGSLVLLVDGQVVASASGLNTGGQKVTSFSVGETGNSGTPSGTIYLDNVSTSTF
jgi:hypothetical protein